MTTDPAAEMRQKYGETQRKTCGECRLWRYCELAQHCNGIKIRKRDPACGKFESDADARARAAAEDFERFKTQFDWEEKARC